jgi:hypothetical protein
MSALLEFECRPAAGGYDVIAFDKTKIRRAEHRSDGGFNVELAPDASEDDRYAVNRWGREWARMWLMFTPQDVIEFLRPRSDRTKRFDLFQTGKSTFVEFATRALTKEGVRALADRYGPLFENDHAGHRIDIWYTEMSALRKAVDLWDKANTTLDFNRVIRALKQPASEPSSKGKPSGTDAKVLLKKDPIEGSARLCIRPSNLRDALWIQLAMAIDGNLNLRTCVECRSWFTLDASRGRSDKEYCSNACRMRAYRKRKGKQ